MCVQRSCTFSPPLCYSPSLFCLKSHFLDSWPPFCNGYWRNFKVLMDSDHQMTDLPGSLVFSSQIYIITSPLMGTIHLKIVSTGTLVGAIGALSIWYLAFLCTLASVPATTPPCLRLSLASRGFFYWAKVLGVVLKQQWISNSASSPLTWDCWLPRVSKWD